MNWGKFFRDLIKKDYIIALFIGLTVILVGSCLAIENYKIVPSLQSTVYSYHLKSHNRFKVDLKILSWWDGPHYLYIAHHGYTSSDLTNFYPLYPVFTKVAYTFVRSYLIGGLVAAWVAFIFSIYFYIRIVREQFSLRKRNDYLQAVLYFVFYPTAMFMLVTYSESLLLAFSLGAYFFTLKKQYYIALPFLLLALLAHPNAVLVWLLVIMLMFEQKAKLRDIFVVGLASLSGFIGYMIYLKIRFHSFFAFLHAQQTHRDVLIFNPHILLREIATRNGIFFILMAIAGIYWWRRKKYSLSIYSFAFMLIIITSNRSLGSLGRYSLLDFSIPLMLYAAFRDKKIVGQFVLIISSILWAYFLLQFAGGYTVG